MGATSKIPIVGNRYVNLLVVEEISKRNKNGHIMYKCLCDCGNYKEILGNSLREGRTKSCGKCNLQGIKHGMWKTKEFNTWQNMLQRCNPLKKDKYKNYAGKGIEVCEKWKESFINFYLDMGDAPSKIHSIDRKDVNGHYTKENCHWATPIEQTRNKTSNRVLLYKGEEKCLSEWCEIFNIAPTTLHNRLLRGWSIEDAIEKPINNKRKDL